MTGVRHDPYANTHPLHVEEEKPATEQGTYLHPDAYGQPETKGVEWSSSQRRLHPSKTSEPEESAITNGGGR